MSNPTPCLPPGFRFHPTDEELILHYLRNRASSRPCPVSIIADIDIYKFDPWDLPAKAMFGEREWYFFTPRDRKYPNGVRPNRSAASGYWKATGTDKPVLASGRDSRSIGVKKALVFYKGKAPKGRKTDWIMHEYRLTGAQRRQEMKPMNFRDYSMRLDDWVLCRIYNKCSKVPVVDLEQEDSGGENVYLPNLPIPSTQQNSVMLHNSSSLSDLLDTVDCSLLSRLLDDQTEDSNTSVSTTERDLKRQKMMDDVSNQEDVGFVHPLKKQGSSCTVSNYTINLKNSLLDQPLFHHQMMMYSHFGWH